MATKFGIVNRLLHSGGRNVVYCIRHVGGVPDSEIEGLSVSYGLTQVAIKRATTEILLTGYFLLSTAHLTSKTRGYRIMVWINKA